MSQDAMGELLGVKKAAISKLEANGLDLSTAAIAKLLEGFPNLSLAWLITGRGQPYEAANSTAVVSLPLHEMKASPSEAIQHRAAEDGAPYGLRAMPAPYAHAQARCLDYTSAFVGAGADINPGQHQPIGEYSLPRPFRPGRTYVLVTVKGTSMEPLLCDGCEILIDTTQRDPSLLIGQLVVVNLTRDHSTEEGATVKLLRKGRGKNPLELHPLNPEHSILRGIRPEQIVGRVVGFP